MCWVLEKGDPCQDSRMERSFSMWVDMLTHHCSFLTNMESWTQYRIVTSRSNSRSHPRIPRYWEWKPHSKRSSAMKQFCSSEMEALNADVVRKTRWAENRSKRGSLVEDPLKRSPNSMMTIKDDGLRRTADYAQSKVNGGKCIPVRSKWISEFVPGVRETQNRWPPHPFSTVAKQQGDDWTVYRCYENFRMRPDRHQTEA